MPIEGANLDTHNSQNQLVESPTPTETCPQQVSVTTLEHSSTEVICKKLINPNYDYFCEPPQRIKRQFFKPKLPVKLKSATRYKDSEEEKHTQVSFHAVKKVKKKHCPHTYFHKSDRQPEIDSNNKQALYYFESFIAECYRYLVPERVPPSLNTIVDRNLTPVAIVSRAIPFTPLYEAPLTKADIDASIYAYFDIPEIEIKLAKLQRSYDISGLDKHDCRPDRSWVKKLDDNAIVLEKCFSSNIKKRFTVKHLKQYLRIKGLAQGIPASLIFEEDDLHRGNLGEDGSLPDVGASFRPMTYEYAASSAGRVESFVRNSERNFWDFRRKHLGKYEFTTEDIEKLPELLHADPFYHPGKLTLQEKAQGWVPSSFISSKNPYSQEEIDCFISLQKHPVFDYHKYATFLKETVSEVDVYEGCMQLHLPQTLKYKNGFLQDSIINHLTDRKKALRSILMKLEPFKTFFTKYGAFALEQIKFEVNERNLNYKNKVTKLKQYLLKTGCHNLAAKYDIKKFGDIKEVEERIYDLLFTKNYQDQGRIHSSTLVRFISDFKNLQERNFEKMNVYKEQHIPLKEITDNFDAIVKEINGEEEVQIYRYSR